MPETRTPHAVAPDPATVAAPAPVSRDPAEPADASEPARTVDGRYLLEEQLGVGATATVWRARDTASGRKVAVKLLHPHLVGDRVALQRMRDEARSARRLTHPGLMPVLGTSISDGEAAVVFPFVEGETLARQLADPEARTDAREAAGIAADVAEALAYAHRSGVVHRDVKPSNILVGHDGRARLLDFGISTPANGTSEAELTGTGMAIGTLPYMSPEQLYGRAAGPPSDVFSLGVVLYEMLTGHRPFPATSAIALAEQQRNPPPPMGLAPAPLVALSLAALAVEPAARPSAADFAHAARAWLADPTNDAQETRQMAVLGALAPAPAAAPGLAPALAPVHAPVRSRVAGRPLVLVLFVGLLVLAVASGLALASDWSNSQFAGPLRSPSATPAAPPSPATDPAGTQRAVTEPDVQPAAEDGGGQEVNKGDKDQPKKSGKGKGNEGDRGRGGEGDDDDDDDD